MPTLLVRNATCLVTMDGKRREIADGGLFARDGWIEQVGPTSELPTEADTVLDFSDHIVLPGLVNTHHHLYQTLTRVIPQAQDVGLFEWLRALYPIWANMTPEDIRISTQVGLCELVMTGCTTASDHLYLFPNGSRLDDEIEAASQIGLRFHASRGSMSLGESQGGLPPDSVVEAEPDILSDCQRVVEAYHNPEPGAMLRIVLAPCSPFSVTPELMRQSAELGRSYGVRLHTHMAETRDEEDFCLEKFGKRPVAYAESLGWTGSDVWWAHCVHVNADEVGLMAQAGLGVAHCPSSNMRLASGIAPVGAYHEAGVHVGLGVDGSASNDSSHMLAEARMALMLARLGAAEGEADQPLMPARRVLEFATLGGAAVLGRDDIGGLEAGKCADFFAVDLNRIDYAGALHDPVAALVMCSPVHVDHVFVQGRPIVEDGRPVGVDLPALLERHGQAAARLVASG